MTPSAHDRTIIDQFTRRARPFAALPAHAEADAYVLTPESTVLDVACGPGILACALAKRSWEVAGIDLTPAMIGQARERQRAADLKNLAWQVGDAAALPFADGAFDRVVTRYSFHHMRTRPWQSRR